MADETPAIDTNGDATAATEPEIEPQEIGHVVLRVRELSRSVPFYELLGFTKVAEIPGIMAFFTATGANHHDLALQQVGAGAPAPSPSMTGLYHVAIRLPSDAHVRAAFHRLVNAGVEVVGASDHAVSHSLYIKDPDGIELELYADVPGWQELDDKLTTRHWDPR
ncbi:MAG: VOC family protein [Actinomycetota bacterium]|nr:VOC family protein [Actinomycetota bacterium]